MLRSSLRRIVAATVVVSLLTVVTLFAVQNIKNAKSLARSKNPVPATAQSIEAGEKVFSQYCKQCHGDKAIRGPNCVCTSKFCPADLRNPQMWKKGEDFVYDTITKGRAPMPHFDTKLTDRQRWDVVNYLHSLSREQRDEGGSS